IPKGGQLVAERLARAGRHHEEHVAARQRRGNRLPLAGAEGGVPEMLVERCVEIRGSHVHEGLSPRRRRFAPPAPAIQDWTGTVAMASSANLPSSVSPSG